MFSRIYFLQQNNIGNVPSVPELLRIYFLQQNNIGNVPSVPELPKLHFTRCRSWKKATSGGLPEMSRLSLCLTLR